MFGKNAAIDLVNRFINISEQIMAQVESYSELEWGDMDPNRWKDDIRHHIGLTMDILNVYDDECKLEEKELDRSEISQFLLIKRGFGDTGAQIWYETGCVGYLSGETEMSFSTIIKQKHERLTISLEDDGNSGFLHFVDRYKKRIRTSSYPIY